MPHVKLLLVAIVALGLSGCATMLRGTKQKLQFQTEPPGANLTIDNATYTTPVKVELKRKGEYSVVIDKEGYRPITFKIKAHWDGLSLIGFPLPGGSLMFVADSVSGADGSFHTLPMIKLQPTTQPTTQPVEFIESNGKLLTREEYEQQKANKKK